MSSVDDEATLLRSVALQNANSILLARQRAEQELVRTKEALRESQERLTAALGAAGTGTFRWNIETDRIEADANLEHIVGLSHSDGPLPLETFIQAIHPGDRDAVRESCARSAADGSGFDLEYRVLWPDGSTHWVHGKGKVFRGAAGKPAYMTGACTDITSRRAAAETLRQSEERLRAMFNQAAVGIAVATLDGRFVSMNRKFSQILGFTEEDLLLRTFRDITHPDDLEATRVVFEQLLAQQIPEYAIEKRYVRSDGMPIWSLTTVTLMKDASGEPDRLIGVIEEITARKNAEAALRDERRILELLNETGKAIGSTLDLQALIQAVTDAATELSGAKFGAFFYNTTDAKGDSFLLFTLSGAPREAFERFGNPRATALFGPTFRGAPPIRSDDVLKDPRYGTMGPHHGMPKGHLPVRSYLAVPVRSRSGEVIGGLFFGHPETHVFTERSERLISGVAAQAGIAIDNARLYEASLRAAEERTVLLESERAARSEAERMSDMKDEFLATLSHELRTPLNAILGWSQVLRTGRKDEAELLKGLQTIERNARAQTQLIEDLLDMSRITSGKLRLDIQPLQPIVFIQSAIETVRPAADAKGIRLNAMLDPSAGPISGDPGRLQQVIWNLLSNAIKFTPRGGRIQVVLERVNSHIEISVADTGVGIKTEFLPHLFERFRQADASTTRKYGGLGIGLSIVKSLVELHGGTVTVKSDGDGTGTTVAVQLPVAVVQRPREFTARQHPASAADGPRIFVPAELAGLKILVVDDQADARDLIKRVLEDCSGDVLTAANAEEALALVESARPDVLISDIGMPGADGFQLLKSVRALGPERGGKVPAIALTAFARSEDRTRALRAGFLVHVSKPVDPSELVATVASVARRLEET